MKAIFMILIITMVGCNPIDQPYRKPFIIIETATVAKLHCGEGYHGYIYQDADGRTRKFCDKPFKYSVGDTIK